MLICLEKSSCGCWRSRKHKPKTARYPLFMIALLSTLPALLLLPHLQSPLKVFWVFPLAQFFSLRWLPSRSTASRSSVAYNLSDCSDLDCWSCNSWSWYYTFTIANFFPQAINFFKASSSPACKRVAYIFMLLINLSTTVGREGPIAWGFIRLHAIGPSPWKGDGSLTIKPSSFHSPTYTTVVVHTTSPLHERSQDSRLAAHTKTSTHWI